jgi:hypothetical protein
MAWRRSELVEYSSPLKGKRRFFGGEDASFSDSYHDDKNKKAAMDVYSPKLGFARGRGSGNDPLDDEAGYKAARGLSTTADLERKLFGGRPPRVQVKTNRDSAPTSKGSVRSLATPIGKGKKKKADDKGLYYGRNLVHSINSRKRVGDDFSPAILGYVPYDSYTDYLHNKVSDKWSAINKLYDCKCLLFLPLSTHMLFCWTRSIFLYYSSDTFLFTVSLHL